MDNISLIIKHRNTLIQLLNYAIIGIATNFIGYIFYLLITYHGANPKITMTLLYTVGVALGFWGNRTLTFSNKGNLIGTGTRYLIAHCFGYLINLGLLFLLVDTFGYAHQWVQAVAIFVVAFFLFIAFKLFVFIEHDGSKVGSE